MKITEKIYGKDYGNILKPNQEEEKKTIELILENEFGIEAEVEIFAVVLPEPRRKFKKKYNPTPEYDQLKIVTDPKYVDKWPTNTNGRFKDFGINYVYCKSYKSKNA